MKNIFITGASTGIGEATALRFARIGWQVYAGVRDDGAAERLRGENIEPVRLDVTDAADIAGLAQRFASEPLDALVNNAGIALGGPLEFFSVERLRKQFEVNVFGVHAVTQALIPALRRARGRIVIIGSIAGKSAMPFMAPYSASKHAIEAYADALRVELSTSGIDVTLLEPGAIKTPIWTKGADRLGAAAAEFPPEASALYGKGLATLAKLAARSAASAQAPEVVAAAVASAVCGKRPPSRRLIGNDAKIQRVLGFLPAPLRDSAVRRLFGLVRG